MVINSKNLLAVLGYEIDGKGNVIYGANQIAIVSLENETGGGILRVHGNDNEFFYSGDVLLEEKNLLFPSKVTPKYVYFKGKDETLRVETKEFVENTLKAFVEFNRLSNKHLAG